MQPEISNERYRSFVDVCRGNVELGPIGVVIAAYATLWNQGGCDDSQTPDDDLADEIRHYVKDGTWLPVGKFSNDELVAIILCDNCSSFRSRGEFLTTRSICTTALGLLHAEPNASLIDLGCGVGNFMVGASKIGLFDSISGIEINYDAAAISKIRARFLPVRASIKLGNVFDLDGSFDCVFFDVPLGIRRRVLERQYGDDAESLVPQPMKFHSGEWLFVLAALKYRKESGRAVVVLGGGPLFNRSDSEVREFLVSKGLVESVVALPQGVASPVSSIARYLVVLSSGNESVRFADARNLGRRERRTTYLDQSDIDEICRMANRNSGVDLSDDERVIDAGKMVIGENDWSLDPVRYMKTVDIPDGVPLSDLISSVTRGASVRASDLDERIVSQKTPYRYLQIRDIVNGEISDDLPYLSSIEDGERRYCVEDGDIVLGKMSPYRVAVASLEPGTVILATGNVYIIKVNRKKFDPIFLKLFLESHEGIAQLEAASVGATVMSIPVSAFDRIVVPRTPLEKQREIAARYRSLRQTIDVYQLKIDRAEEEISSLLEESGD